MSMEKKIRLRKRNGEEFIGTPEQCADILVGDALMNHLYTGSFYAIWSAQDFCENFGLSARLIAHDAGVEKITTINPFTS